MNENQRSVDFIYKGVFKNILMRAEKIRVLKENHRYQVQI